MLYISGSNRKNNCYEFLKDIMNDSDKLISLSDLNIKYCTGCISCEKEIENYCILNDDMNEIYEEMLKTDKIIIMTPIYMNQITGLLKNMIDRLNPFCIHESLRKKKIYLITVGQVSEDENEEIKEDIEKYFKGISEFFYFDFEYLKNLSSGEMDSIKSNYENYKDIINELKEKIRGDM